MPPRKQHDVSVVVDGIHVEGWTDYDIQTDMLEIADSFSMSIPFTKVRWDVFGSDATIRVYIDRVRILEGFIDDRKKTSSRQGSLISIAGRDKGGRLVDESMPLVKLKGKKIKELAELVVGKGTAVEWFSSVVLENTRNRNLVRGKGRKARRAQGVPTVSEDAAGNISYTTPSVGIVDRRDREKKVNPGESRWDVLRHYLEEAGLLAWSAADGNELVIGLPDYNQEHNYWFFHAGLESSRAQAVNVLSMNHNHSSAERYSQLTVCGTGRGNSSNYGKNVLKRRATVQNADTDLGDGEDFTAPKRLLVAEGDVRTVRMAKERAEQRMAERDASREEIIVSAPYHGQIVDGDEPAIYAFDTIALVEDEELSLAEEYLITSARYASNRGSGETTEMRMVPKGTVLRL